MASPSSYAESEAIVEVLPSAADAELFSSASPSSYAESIQGLPSAADAEHFSLRSLSSDEFDFVETPVKTKYYCTITRDLLWKEPHLTLCCGQHISLEAVNALQTPQCPFCQEPELKTVHDPSFEWKVNKLKVKCPRRNAGCPWVGDLRYISSHLEECDQQEEECEFKDDGCTAKPRRTEMAGHKRNCVTEHLSMVTKKTKYMLQQQADTFMQQLTLLQTRLQEQESRLQEQESTLKRQTTKLQQQEASITDLQQEVEQFRQVAIHITPNSLDLTPSFTFIPPPAIVITNFSENKSNGNVWYSPPFYSHFGGYKMCLAVYADGTGKGAGTHVSVCSHMMKGEYDDNLLWPFNGVITLQLMHCTAEEATAEFNMKCAGQVTKVQRGGSGWGLPQFVSHSALTLANDSLTIKVINIKRTLAHTSHD